MDKHLIKIGQQIKCLCREIAALVLLPALVPGDAGKVVAVNETEDGYELVTQGSGSGSTPTLAEVLTEGNQTGENDIEAKDNSVWNGARLVVGPNRAGFGNGEYNNGGDKGVTQYCANGFALDFQNGELRHRQQGSNAPKPLPTISPIKYPGTVFDGLNNPSADDPILEITNINFIGDFAADFETYFNYTSTFRVYCYDGSGILLAIGKYDGVNYVDPLTTLYLYDVTNIVEGATIDQIVKVVGYDWNEDTLITQRRGKELFVEKATQLFEYTALVTINTAGSNITENEIINNLTINVMARLSAGIYYFSLPENSRPLLPIITDISAQASQEAFCLTTSNNDLFCRVYLYKDSDYTNRVYMATKADDGTFQDDLLSQNLISFKSL